MPIETPPVVVEKQQTEKKSPHVYWIAGALGTKQGGNIIREQLEQTFNTNGEENVTYFHSAASVDIVDLSESETNRYTQSSAEILSRLQNNQEVVVAVHSFGAQELRKLIEKLEVHPDFESLAKKLMVVLVAPYGVVESVSSVFNLLRVVEIARSQVALGPLNSFRQGVESINYLAPKTVDTTILETALTEVFKDQSNYYPLAAQTVASFSSSTTDTSFFSRLDQTKQDEITQKVASVDKRLADCIAQKNWFIFERLLKERGRLLAPEMDEAYKGGVEVPEQSMSEMYKTLAQAQLGLNGMISNVIHGEVFNAIRRVRSKGTSIKAVFPEFDAIYTLDELKVLLEIESDEELAETVAILSSTTHASFSFNAAGLAQAVKHLITKPE